MAEYSWLLISGAFVFLMQAGFLCLESGRIRSKNSINVAAKNIADFIISSIVFWLFGFALMFGDSVTGFIGSTGFIFGEQHNPYQTAFFLFQMMFCSTATTLMSGAVAERMTFNGYLLITIILSAVIYPITGHWAWSSAYTQDNHGWLQALGFVDFAGSTVVHSVGGWVSLSAIIIIGPRLGRFSAANHFPVGNNLPMSVLGTLLIWFGWFGFNGGSTLVMNGQVPVILLNTCLSAAWGGLVATLLQYLKHKYVDVGLIMNGTIAGLVGITASCHAVTPGAAAIIGVVSGVVVFFGTTWIEKLHIDDALGVVPAHLFAGIWGTLAVGIFGQPQILATGLTHWQQLGVQALGIITIGSYSFIFSYLLMRMANRVLPLRVDQYSEEVGLNVSEHKATTELIDLLTSMQKHQDHGDFSSEVPVEPFTEVGQIAQKYNQVINQVNAEIIKRDQAINSFQSSEKRKSAILDSSMDCIISIDRKGNIIEFNPAAERTFGCLKSQVIGKNFIEHFILPDDLANVYNSLQLMFATSQGLVLNRRNSLLLKRISGHQFPAEITITRTHLNIESDHEFTLHIRDVTRQIKLQNRLRFLAYSDPLTGLYNRTYLMEKLISSIEQAKKTKETVAILFLDLDKFKKINDTLGHKAGDELLCEVASRLTRVTRENDIIARWGGDEFVLMFVGDLSRESACEKANNILTVMRVPVSVGQKILNIPTSIGVSVSTAGDTDADKMIQYADIAMYSAKEKGRDNYQVFETEMMQLATRNFHYEQAMKDALNSEQISLVYQPKVDALHNRIVGLESLVRWKHGQEGNIPPADFIPLAEESNLIILLGERVISDAIIQLRKWREKNIELVPVSVNISGKHLISEELVPFIQNILAMEGIAGEFLEIEITEGVLLTDLNRCIEVMSELKKLNIKISVDDFGTGYSSLNYLKRLPIDILKIDRTFVEECDTTEEDGQICSTIINLAKNLDLVTVAEGVETPSQLAFLQQHGCDIYQGYYFYRPQPPQFIEKLLMNNQQSFKIMDA